MPIDPDTQDDEYEQRHVQRILDNREEININDPRVIRIDDFEVNTETSIKCQPMADCWIDEIELS